MQAQYKDKCKPFSAEYHYQRVVIRPGDHNCNSVGETDGPCDNVFKTFYM